MHVAGDEILNSKSYGYKVKMFLSLIGFMKTKHLQSVSNNLF
jgi:hypothetical protein